jgi:hypothetical protein
LMISNRFTQGVRLKRNGLLYRSKPVVEYAMHLP